MTKTVFIVFCLLLLVATSLAQSTGDLSRSSFNGGWLFEKGDPAEAEGKLSYANIRDWVIPTGNEFVSGLKKVTRPQGNVGQDVRYTQATFDDSGWRKLDLPHDWGIEGDFVQEVPGGTGKRPW